LNGSGFCSGWGAGAGSLWGAGFVCGVVFGSDFTGGALDVEPGMRFLLEKLRALLARKSSYDRCFDG
jgi:hypothetical protein